jgi:type IV secretory pathway TrbF-like protein
MNDATPIRSLTTRNDEAQVRLVENEAHIAAGKAQVWRHLGTLSALLVLAAIGGLIYAVIYALLSLTPWH